MGKPQGKYHLEDPDIDGRIILKWMRNWMGRMDWIDGTQNRDRWWTVVNAVVNLQLPLNA
jgi:hypothetical protein